MCQVLKGDVCLPNTILADELSLLSSTNPQPVGCRTQWQLSVILILQPLLSATYFMSSDQVLPGWELHLATVFVSISFLLSFDSSLCLLWLAVGGWINGRWCLWWHPPAADPCGGLIPCNNLLWLRTLQKQFKAFPQKTWKIVFQKSLRGLNK